MSKTVAEVLKSIEGKPGKNGEITPNRFSKKAFNELLIAMINDPDFKETVVKKAGKEDVELEQLMVTNDFRVWLKKQLEKAGVDKSDSQIVLSKDFEITNVDGLYEFFTTVIYQYMNAGNKYDIIPHEDFKGSIYLKNVKESKKVVSGRNPATGEDLGESEITKKAHKVLAVKSSCPTYLSSKRKIK